MVWAQHIVNSVVFLFLIFIAFNAVLAHELVADESLKADWHIPAKTNEIIFIGDATKQAPVLRLNVAALKSAPCGLNIDSDAKSLSLASGTTRITVPANRPMKLVLGMSPDHPVLRVNDRDMPQFRGRWLQICLNGERHIMLEFETASYVNIRRDESEPEAVSQRLSSAIVPAPTTAPAAGTTADSEDFIGSLSQSVFQIKVFDDDREVFASGTGFVVDSDGLGLTSFHVVHGASGAVARFPGRTDEAALELIAARPDLDLALVRISGISLPPAIPIESRDPRPGEQVWALGYPLDLGFTVNRGVVAGLRRYTDLPPLLRDSLREYSDSSVWIQTDCTMNPGNSGGPLVNNGGRVVGINTWTWQKNIRGEDVNNVFFALRATQANAVLVSRDSPPLTFAKAREIFKSRKTPLSLLPTKLPRIEMPRNSRPDELRAAAAAVINGLMRNCPACSGRGYLEKRVKVGERQNGPFVFPEIRTLRFTCEDCRGLKQLPASDDSVERLVLKLTTIIATSKPGDQQMQSAFRQAYVALHEHVGTNADAMLMLATRARSLLAQERPRVGVPLAFPAAYMFGTVIDEKGKRAHLVTLYDTEQIAVITEPVLFDEIDHGVVFVGGLVAGTSKSRDGRRLAVIQDGYMIRLPNFARNR